MIDPGFYQSHLRGRASGRVSPRPALRGPVRERVLANHGLLDQGRADPNQGQLFPDTEAGPVIPAATLARQRGVPAPLPSSAPGFMPSIKRSTPQATRKTKALALTKVADARIRTGADRGTGAPIREAMEDRLAIYDRGKPADWYQAVSEGRNVHGPGMAHELIENAAMRTGTSFAKMARATALSSPRTAWDEGGAPGTTDFTRPNLASAEAVVRTVHSLPDGASRDQVREAGHSTHGEALGEAKAKAADYHANVPVTAPIGISDKASQKVPNFEQSLHMGHIDPAIVRGAAGSYTVDRWDAETIGGDEKMLKSEMGYAVAHMTGVRAAHKVGELPPNFQARTWNAARDMAQPATMGTNRLFVSKRSGRLEPNPNALPTERVSPTWNGGSRSSRRQSTADKYDLEF